jgi:hypothetical protein
MGISIHTRTQVQGHTYVYKNRKNCEVHEEHLHP